MAGKPPVLVGRSPFFKNRRAKNYDPKSFGERGAHGHFRGEVQPLLLGLLPVEHCTLFVLNQSDIDALLAKAS